LPYTPKDTSGRRSGLSHLPVAFVSILLTVLIMYTGGEITYIPDSADDMDEEDPDEDLEI
jgi:hypothetical protein